MPVCQEGDNLMVWSLLCLPNGGLNGAQDYPVACAAQPLCQLAAKKHGAPVLSSWALSGVAILLSLGGVFRLRRRVREG